MLFQEFKKFILFFEEKIDEFIVLCLELDLNQ